MVGVRWRKDPSDSSASTTIHSPLPRRALDPKALSLPPTTAVGCRPACSSTVAIRLVVVVLPCDPAMATASLRRISSESISARRMTGMPRARAATASGLVARRTALEVTTTSTSGPTFSARWPSTILPPSEARRRVISLSLRSDPLTPYPRFRRSSAMPLIPMPPIPTKWTFTFLLRNTLLTFLRWNIRDSIHDNQYRRGHDTVEGTPWEWCPPSASRPEWRGHSWCPPSIFSTPGRQRSGRGEVAPFPDQPSRAQRHAHLGDLPGGLGPAQQAALPRHPAQPRAVALQRAHLVGQLLPGQLALGQEDRRSVPHHAASVDRLVVVSSVGKGDQDRRLLADGQLGDGGRAGAAEEQVGLRVGLGHVLDEGRRLRVHAAASQRLIPPADLLQVLLAGLVHDAQPRAQRGRELLERLRHAEVQDVRALRPAGDEDREALPGRLLRVQVVVQKRAPDRVAQQVRPGGREPGPRLVEGDEAGPREPAQGPVGEPGQGVLLLHRGGDTQKPRGHHHRAAGVSAHPHHHVRVESPEDPARLPQRAGDAPQTAHRPERTLP